MESNAELARQLLVDAVASDPKGKSGVAIRLGYGRSLISRVLSPNDPLEMSEKLEKRVIDCFHVIPECPATLQEQARSECQRISGGHAPTHNPLSMRIWRACQTCPHKPEVTQ